MNTTVLAGSGYRWEMGESVWCQPSSGSETTCERPNQAAQRCVVPMLGLPSQVWGPLRARGPVQVEPSAVRGWKLEAQAPGWP